MRWLILILTLVPAASFAHSPTNSGAWTTAAIWDTGTVPTSTSNVTNYDATISVSSFPDNQACKSLIWGAGTLSFPPSSFGPSVPDVVFSNCVLSMNASRTFSVSNLTIGAGVTTAAMNVRIFTSVNSFSSLLSVSPVQVIISGFTIYADSLSTTGTAIKLSTQSGGGFVFSNSLVRLGQLIVTNGFCSFVGGTNNFDLNFSGLPGIDVQNAGVMTLNNTLLKQSTRDVSTRAGGSVYATNSTWFVSEMIGSTLYCDASFFMQNSTLLTRLSFLRGSGTGCVLSVTNATTSLAASLSADSLSISTGGTLNTAGFSVSTGTISNRNVLVGSNSTLVVSNAISSGRFSNMTSSIQVSQSSDLTNYWSCVPAGTVTLTNAAISVSGTLAGQAGSSINLGTLTLSNPGFVPMVSNVTLPAASQPLNATTTRNAGGKLNDLMRRGAE